jgi:hypothetical protein
VASLPIKAKKERLEPLFFMLDTFHLDNRPKWIESSKLHILRAGILYDTVTAARQDDFSTTANYTAQTR